jgi:hypothetical protein
VANEVMFYYNNYVPIVQTMTQVLWIQQKPMLYFSEAITKGYLSVVKMLANWYIIRNIVSQFVMNMRILMQSINAFEWQVQMP